MDTHCSGEPPRRVPRRRVDGDTNHRRITASFDVTSEFHVGFDARD
jgi:hypothetical protein